MSTELNIKISQINFCVGDLEGNTNKIHDSYNKSNSDKLDLIVFSELCVIGYPPEDLLHKPYFSKAVEYKIDELCKLTENKHTAIIIGAPVSFTDNKYDISELYNCALLIEDGAVIRIIRKNNIPNYGVFDEKRYFKQAPQLSHFEFRGFQISVLICEDIWSKKNAFLLSDKKLDAIITINASPFSQRKIEKRQEISRKFIENIKSPLIYVNQVGAQDSVVFDGSSFIINKDGESVLELAEFTEDEAEFTIDKDKNIITQNKLSEQKTPSDDLNYSRMYNCCILGVRDYLAKNNFNKVVIGMSGGIDSALCAAITVDAIGSENVKLVALPSKYNSQTSFDDANECSNNLEIELESISIEESFKALENSLSKMFAGKKPDLTEENMQSRLRGNILMAISNKLGHILLTTGNKSEMAVGYATIYGDMCGSLNPIKDLYKTEVYKLSNWRNKNIPKISVYNKTDIIPQNIITKEPTAELRENQKDSDSLPDYNTLDTILYNLIEEEKSIAEITKLGFEEDTVKKVAKLLYNSEYKRKQAVIGIKVSKMSFDKDRRYQITNKFCI